MRVMLRGLVLVIAVLGFCVVAASCGAGGDATNVYIFPEDGGVVARNAAVWMEVYPSSVRVRNFGLYEVYAGQLYPVACNSYTDTYTNEFIFCPSQVLSAWTTYYVEARIGSRTYGWYFETDGGYDGDPRECYYVTYRGVTGRAAK